MIAVARAVGHVATCISAMARAVRASVTGAAVQQEDGSSAGPWLPGVRRPADPRVVGPAVQPTMDAQQMEGLKRLLSLGMMLDTLQPPPGYSGPVTLELVAQLLDEWHSRYPWEQLLDVDGEAQHAAEGVQHGPANPMPAALEFIMRQLAAPALEDLQWDLKMDQTGIPGTGDDKIYAHRSWSASIPPTKAIRQVISMAHNDPSGFRAALDISAAYWWLLDNPGQVIVFVGGLMTAPLLLPLIAQLKVVLPKQVVLVRGQEKATTDITHPWAATAAATALFRLLPVMAMSQAMGVMDEYVMKAFVQVAAQMNMCYEEVHASAEAMDKVSQLL